MLEVIALSRDDALEAEAGGASRLELTCAIEQDGLTPARALVEDVLRAVRVPVRVMLRPRDSFSIESPAELEALCALAAELAALPVDGFVLGFLREGEIDTHALTQLLPACAPRPVTFHRAIEHVTDPAAALATLRQHAQVDTVLCSGGPGNAAARVSALARMHEHIAGRLTLLAGGGVDDAMLSQMLTHTTIRDVHIGRAARMHARWDAPIDPRAVARLAAQLNAAACSQ